jgi:hypothetical protein
MAKNAGVQGGGEFCWKRFAAFLDWDAQKIDGFTGDDDQSCSGPPENGLIFGADWEWDHSVNLEPLGAAFATAFPSIDFFFSLEFQGNWLNYEIWEAGKRTVSKRYNMFYNFANDDYDEKKDRAQDKVRMRAAAIRDAWLAEEPSCKKNAALNGAIQPGMAWLEKLKAMQKSGEAQKAELAPQSVPLAQCAADFPFILRYIDMPPEEIILAALRSDAGALRWLNKDGKIAYTSERCKAALEACPLKEFPPELLSAEIYDAAVEKSGLALADIPENMRTAELCIKAVEQNPLALQFVPETLRTVELCRAAYQKNNACFEFIPEAIRQEIGKLTGIDPYMAAVQKDFHALKDIPAGEQTFDVCMAAIKQNPFAAFRLVKKQTPELCLAAVKLDGLNVLPLVKEQTPEICAAAVAQNPKAAMFARVKGGTKACQ